jgi:TRAP transporter TAXI family solute receptor
MKKIVLMFACCALIVLTGCQPKKTNLILATGGTSGTYYPFGGAMAQIFNTKIKNMNVTAQATGASKENIRLIAKGEAELAIVQNDVMDYAAKGIELFNNEKVEGFSTIATLYPEVIQIVGGPENGIATVADMKNKRVSVGDAGSGVEANAKQILEAYGLTFDSLKASRLSFKESGNAYKDKQLDAFFVTAGIPNAAIQEIGALGKVSLVSIDDATMKRLMDTYSFYTPFTIGKDVYNGLAADVKTVAVKATLICKTSLEEDVVYEITKALFENQAELAAAHAKGKELRIEEAVMGVSVPLHSGAVKYYKEKGILK